MATIDEVLAWNTGTLTQVSKVLYLKRTTLVNLQDEVNGSTVPDSWVGDAANAARGAHGKLVDRLRDLIAELSKVAASLDFASDEIAAAKAALEDAITRASKKNFTVNRKTGDVSGEVTDVPEGFIGPVVATQEDLDAVAKSIGDALAKANQADADLAAAMKLAEDGKIEGKFGPLFLSGLETPLAIDNMSGAQIAERYGSGTTMAMLRSWLGFDAEFASWKLEGKGEASYAVYGGGAVVMALAIEVGGGRFAKLPGPKPKAKGSLTGGGTWNYSLKFDSVPEANAFLRELEDELKGVVDDGADRTAADVLDLVGKQDVASARLGVYGSAEGEFNSNGVDSDKATQDAKASGIKAGGEFRVDVYRELASDDYNWGVTAKVSASGSGPAGGGFEGDLAADAKFQGSELQEVTLSGQVNPKIGDNESTASWPDVVKSGQSVDVEMKITRDHPDFDRVLAAVNSGDFGTVKDIALQDSELTIRSISTESAEGEWGGKAFGQGAKLEYGTDAELTNQVWHRPEGKQYFVEYDPIDAAQNIKLN